MGKFSDYVKPMFLREDEFPRANRPGTWVFGQEYRFLKDYCKYTPLLLEYIPLLPAEKWKGPDPRKEGVFRTANVERDGHKGGGFYAQIRHDAEMMWFFLGTDPDHPKDLGAHIEFSVGLGDDKQTFSFDEPCCVHVPRGLANCGMRITNQTRPILNINVFDQPTKEACYIEHTYFPLPTDENIEIDRGSDRVFKNSEVTKELG